MKYPSSVAVSFGVLNALRLESLGGLCDESLSKPSPAGLNPNPYPFYSDELSLSQFSHDILMILYPT